MKFFEDSIILLCFFFIDSHIVNRLISQSHFIFHTTNDSEKVYFILLFSNLVDFENDESSIILLSILNKITLFKLTYLSLQDRVIGNQINNIGYTLCSLKLK